MISIPWAWDVNKYQILVPLIPLKVPKSILEVFKTLPEICSQHLILQSGPTVHEVFKIALPELKYQSRKSRPHNPAGFGIGPIPRDSRSRDEIGISSFDVYDVGIYV